MSTLKNVLVGTDFSTGSRSAIRLAAAIARAHGSRLVIAHVVHTDPAGDYVVRRKDVTGDDLRVEGARARLERLAKPIRASGLAVETVVTTGKPYADLLGVAERFKADLLVVGTRGLGRVQRFLLGSTAERLVRAAPMPVLVAKGTAKATPIRRIYVGVDFSAGSKRALETAVGLAKPLEAQVTAVHAIDFGSLSDQMSAAPDRRRLTRRAAEAELAEFVLKRFPGNGTAAPKVRVVESPADESLALAAVRQKVDLIVLGSVGRSGVDALLIGNTAERVLRRSSLPVLVVKPPGFGR